MDHTFCDAASVGYLVSSPKFEAAIFWRGSLCSGRYLYALCLRNCAEKRILTAHRIHKRAVVPRARCLVRRNWAQQILSKHELYCTHEPPSMRHCQHREPLYTMRLRESARCVPYGPD